MKVIKDELATLKRHRRVTVELQQGEELLSIKDGCYYRLGGQVEDIVQAHVLAGADHVYWCSISQRWERA